MNEAETRAEHIDPALRAAGWGVVEGSVVRREFRITQGRLQGGGVRAKPEIADYVLVYRNTKLAVIEAKAWDKPHTEGVAHAKSYATKLAIRHSYATNGQAIYGIDMATGVEGDVAAFPGPDALWALSFAEQNAWRDRFAAVPYPNKSGTWDIRFYQEIAVSRVLEKISNGDARNVRNIVLLRPVNSMIEFKQIIGRGTRLYEGKDYFTIYDFVKAHQLFSDPEWDGEPVEAEERKPKPTLQPGVAEPSPLDITRQPRATKIKVLLADGKARSIQSMVATSFWGADGKPLSAAQFMESLFGALPEFFKDEAQLRTIWSDPTTRKALLTGLADKGFSRAPLAEMQKIIEAEKSDLFDVLAYIAFASTPETRAVRAAQASSQVKKLSSENQFSDRQQAFVDFVLAQYVSQGVDELDTEKLSPLLRLRYNNAIADAVKDLGSPDQIRQVFVGFQRYLYQF